MNFCDNVQFPKRYKPLPPGYRIMQLDSGHFLWTLDGVSNRNGGPVEGLISWDRYWVRRCVFAHFNSGRKHLLGAGETKSNPKKEKR